MNMKNSLSILNNQTPTEELATVEALQQLWNEVSQKPLYASPNFWRYIKLRWKMKLKLEDASEFDIRVPKWKTNDCSSCTDICCVGPHSAVTLGFKDIAMLIDIERTDLISHHKPAFDENVLNNRPALRKHVATQSWKQFPSLKTNTMGACSALELNGSCGLYPYWPMSCARFPYSAHIEEKKIFYSKRCDSFWIRPDTRDSVHAMALSAVANYNERIKDLVLLEYAPERLESLGLMKYLKQDNPKSD